MSQKAGWEKLFDWLATLFPIISFSSRVVPFVILFVKNPSHTARGISLQYRARHRSVRGQILFNTASRRTSLSGAPLKFGSHFSYFRDGQGSEARGSAPQSNPWQTHPVKWQMPSHGSAAGETGFLHLPSLVEQEVFCPIRCSGWGDFGLQPFTFKGLCRENEPPPVAQEQTALWRWAEERVWEQAVPTSLANIPSPWTSKAEKNCAFKTKVDSFAYLS